MSFAITIVTEPTSRAALKTLAGDGFGDMVKVVIDVERCIMAVGAELHVDEEQVLLQHGSNQENVWGINLYPDVVGDSWIEFDSMVNIRPRQNNRTRAIQDPIIQQKIIAAVHALVKDA